MKLQNYRCERDGVTRAESTSVSRLSLIKRPHAWDLEKTLQREKGKLHSPTILTKFDESGRTGRAVLILKAPRGV